MIEGPDYWDLVLQPQYSIFELNLRDVWRYRDLLWLFVRRDVVSFYKQTILGPFWFFVQPLFTTIMYTFIFGGLANISADGLPKPLFYLAGITTWNYFSDCITRPPPFLRTTPISSARSIFPG